METWSPTASLDSLRHRAELLARVRDFFRRRGVWEVETPILSHHGSTDPQIESFATTDGHWLQTSPEFAMKRLLAAGSGPIYQVCKAFRRGERGRRHNPEFTLLEWYRPGYDDRALMAEVAELVVAVLADRQPLGEPLYLSYQEACLRYAGVDPLAAPVAALAAAARGAGIHIEMAAGESGRDDWLDLLMCQVVEPALPPDRPVFVYHYPASQAALARLAADRRVARRFELFCGGMELANGFYELADAQEQAARFAAERGRRALRGQPDVPADVNLLAALHHGLPECAGVALGLDRLFMLALGQAELDGVVAFPAERA